METLAKSTVAFVGSGLMAEAMIKGLLAGKVMGADRIRASGPRQERGDYLRKTYAVRTSTDNAEAVEGAQVVILSIKPQVLDLAMGDLHGRIPQDALVLSIVAGGEIKAIEHGLDHRGVVRAMPNTPAQIGKGITVWTASEAVTEDQLEQARAILGALGEEIFVEDEDFLNMATALSGTGPAYVFLLMEAMVDAGVHLGFPRYIAERLVLETVSGSAEYVRNSARHLGRLRNEVTSPGGTSAEALYYLEKAGIRTALSRAIWAAYQRSVSLGRGKKKDRLGNEARGNDA